MGALDSYLFVFGVLEQVGCVNQGVVDGNYTGQSKIITVILFEIGSLTNYWLLARADLKLN